MTGAWSSSPPGSRGSVFPRKRASSGWTWQRVTPPAVEGMTSSAFGKRPSLSIGEEDRPGADAEGDELPVRPEGDAAGPGPLLAAEDAAGGDEQVVREREAKAGLEEELPAVGAHDLPRAAAELNHLQGIARSVPRGRGRGIRQGLEHVRAHRREGRRPRRERVQVRARRGRRSRGPGARRRRPSACTLPVPAASRMTLPLPRPSKSASASSGRATVAGSKLPACRNSARTSLRCRRTHRPGGIRAEGDDGTLGAGGLLDQPAEDGPERAGQGARQRDHEFVLSVWRGVQPVRLQPGGLGRQGVAAPGEGPEDGAGHGAQVGEPLAVRVRLDVAGASDRDPAQPGQVDLFAVEGLAGRGLPVRRSVASGDLLAGRHRGREVAPQHLRHAVA